MVNVESKPCRQCGGHGIIGHGHGDEETCRYCGGSGQIKQRDQLTPMREIIAEYGQVALALERLAQRCRESSLEAFAREADTIRGALSQRAESLKGLMAKRMEKPHYEPLQPDA